MDVPNNERQFVAERLAPLAEGLAGRQYGPDEFEAARQELRDVAAVMADVDGTGPAAGSCPSTAAAVLSDLAEIAACSLTDMDGAESRRLVDCMAEGVSLLQEAVRNRDTSSEPLNGFLETVRRDWSDCLAVVEPAESDGGTDRDLRVPAKHGSADPAEGAGWEAPAPSPDDVQTILRALAGQTKHEGDAAESQDAESELAEANNSAAHDHGDLADPFACLRGESEGAGPKGRFAPPARLPAVDDVALDPELLGAYLCDAEACLAAMERAVLESESGGGEVAVQQLCRELHTLKGASASVGMTSLAEYLHQVEEWLERAGPSGPPENLDSILSCIDVVREWAQNQQYPPGGEAAESEETEKDVRLRTPSGGVEDDSLRVKASQVDRLMDLLADLVMLRSQRDRHSSNMTAIHDELQRCIARLHTIADGLALSAGELPQLPANSADHPRSRGEGQLLEIAGDLTEVARSLKALRDPLVDENRAVSQFIRQFRHELMELRRMPVAGLFHRLRRVVRDAARVENKQVRMQMIGEHAGLERSVQEKLYEPLLHLVRNAVSHGIESESDRIRAGKEAVGTITLEATGGAQLLVLEIRDDGRGLDYEAIRRRGIERGLIAADQQASHSQLAQLIFHPGFSTRDQANSVAGRGVGMDVVASTLRRMHARVDVDSEPGEGTSVRLRIPLRSVIEHTMLFRLGGQLFALPVGTTLGRCPVRATSDDARRGPNNESTAEGSQGPPIRLAGVLGLPERNGGDGRHCLVLGQSGHRGEVGPGVAERGGNADGSYPGSAPQGSARRVVGHRRAPTEGWSGGRVRDSRPAAVTVMVDEILGPDEVVVRSLPPLLRRNPLLAGATLSGGGEIVQLLDSDRVVEACLAYASGASNSATAVKPSASEAAPEGVPRVLVVDDSLSARRSLMQKLRPRGFELHEAGDGFEALDRLRAENFDMVFSDLEMPRMGGFDLLAEIRSNRKTRSLPVVIVTTRGGPEHRERAAELGSNGYLTKPVCAPDLERIVERIVADRDAD